MTVHEPDEDEPEDVLLLPRPHRKSPLPKDEEDEGDPVKSQEEKDFSNKQPHLGLSSAQSQSSNISGVV